jgi:hypothetical protein
VLVAAQTLLYEVAENMNNRYVRFLNMRRLLHGNAQRKIDASDNVAAIPAEQPDR